jgi:hypothetical protein
MILLKKVKMNRTAHYWIEKLNLQEHPEAVFSGKPIVRARRSLLRTCRNDMKEIALFVRPFTFCFRAIRYLPFIAFNRTSSAFSMPACRLRFLSSNRPASWPRAVSVMSLKKTRSCNVFSKPAAGLPPEPMTVTRFHSSVAQWRPDLIFGTLSWRTGRI